MHNQNRNTSGLPEVSPHPLREWREARKRPQHRTQLWVADCLGVSVAQVSRIERGRNMPRPDLALRITSLTGISVDALARACASSSPVSRSTRIAQARALINRGTAMLAAAED